MEFYLVRHTTPKVPPGFCYGQADVPLAETFLKEAERIARLLPFDTPIVSSPSSRCRKLAEYLQRDNNFFTDSRLLEVSFGQWESRRWKDLNREETEPWCNNFVHAIPPGGESLEMLSTRVDSFFEEYLSSYKKLIIITHAGPIKVALLRTLSLPLQEFPQQTIPYGGVVHLRWEKERKVLYSSSH